MNPNTSAAKLDESLGIDGSGTGFGVGRLVEAYRLASELVDRPRGVSGTSGAKCPADRRIESFLNDYFADLKPAVAAPPARRRRWSCPGTASPASCRSPRTPTATATTMSARTACGTACCTIRRTRPPHHRRGPSTSPRGACRFPATRRPSPSGPPPPVPPRPVTSAADLLVVPFTADRPEPSRGFVSLLLRPIVCPEVPGVCPRQVRWRSASSRPGAWSATSTSSSRSSATPATPTCPRTTPALDVEHWTGHTGCVIARPAPDPAHQEGAGPAAWEAATERQRARRHGLA